MLSEVTVAAKPRVRRLLLVEDDADTRAMLTTILDEEGFEVRPASNGAEALELLRQSAPLDAIITDLMMPVMTGWEFLVELRAQEETARIPVVVISAFYDPARSLGRVRFVPKPLRLDSFLAAIEESCSSDPSASDAPPCIGEASDVTAAQAFTDPSIAVQTAEEGSGSCSEMLRIAEKLDEKRELELDSADGLCAEVTRKGPHGLTIWRLESDEPESLRLVVTNAAAGRMLGVDVESAIGKPFLEAFPNVPAERLRAYADVARSGRGAYLGEVSYRVRGARGLFAVHAVPVGNRCVALVFENVTERRHAQDQLTKVSSFLDSIVENIPDMIFVKDAEQLRFERINRAGEDLLGLRREALLGKNDYDLFPREQADFFQAADRATLRKGAAVDIPEEPIETPNGTRWLHTKKIPIRNGKSQPAYLLGISEDITERRQAQRELEKARDELELRVQERTADLLKANEALRRSEEQLQHSQKMEAVGRLAGGVAHDFNNMLSVILSYSDLIASGLSERDPMREDLKQIKDAAERAAGLTKQLLAFSRQQVLQPRPLDLNAVVTGTNKMLQRLIGEDIDLSRHLQPSLGRVSADPGQIEQVLLNLAVNARDAMPNGGKLTIETANVELDEAYAREHLGVTAGPHVMLAVSDSGTGMTAEVKSRIFEPFFTTKPQGKGTGLGLATVFGIVNQSGGNIWVYSEVGKGTTFKIYLPEIVQSREVEAAAPPVVDELGGSETILLVEDEDLVRRAARSSLRRLGYTILEASNAGEALLLCERYSGTIHLMITDVVMPNMNGPELAKRLSAIRPDLKVLFMSGYTDDAIVHHGVLEQGVEFLQKPFTPAVLARKVREVLGKRPSSRT